MSANEEPTTSATADAQNAPNSNGTTNEPSDAAAAESTSKANEAATDVEAPSMPPADVEDKQDTGKETDLDMKAAETAEGAESSTTVVAPDNGEQPSAKKDNKRRASTAPGSAKKLNKKKSTVTLQLDAKPGDYYWARLKGYPPWPGIICDDDMLPESLLANRPVTAMRADGTYREDFADGGKNVRDRTYPVMYLHTNEFSWMPNVDLKPLHIDEVKNAEQGKKPKQLWGAYQVAAEGHDLQYFKDLLAQFEVDMREEAAEAEAAAAAAAEAKAAKAEKKKSVKKSKATVDDEDTEMVDEDADPEAEEEGAKKPKSSKKRKKDAESEGEGTKPAKTPKTKSLKLNTKASNGETPTPATKKTKAKTPKAAKETKATPKEPELTEEEKKDKREKEVLYFRHKLQKGFLTSEAPKDTEMSTMAGYFDQLEGLPELEQGIIRTTKIHKVLKAILKLGSIPKDEDYHFKDRSMALLTKWQKVLTDGGEGDGDKTEAAAAVEKVETPVADEKTEDVEMTEDAEAKDIDEPAEAPKEEDADKEFVPADEEAKEETGDGEAKAEVTETIAE